MIAYIIRIIVKFIAAILLWLQGGPQTAAVNGMSPTVDTPEQSVVVFTPPTNEYMCSI